MLLQIYTQKIQARRVQSVGRCEWSEASTAARIDGQADLGHVKTGQMSSLRAARAKNQWASGARVKWSVRGLGLGNT